MAILRNPFRVYSGARDVLASQGLRPNPHRQQRALQQRHIRIIGGKIFCYAVMVRDFKDLSDPLQLLRFGEEKTIDRIIGSKQRYTVWGIMHIGA